MFVLLYDMYYLLRNNVNVITLIRCHKVVSIKYGLG